MAERNIRLGKWELKGYYPYVPFLGKTPETGGEPLGVTDWIAATVPGSVQHDLWKADIIADPYHGMNSIHCEWVENRWWVYRTTFDFEPDQMRTIHLCFQGLDYKAHLFLNQRPLGTHEGMFVPLSLDVTEMLRSGGNELTVVFEHAPDIMGQIGYTSETKSLKSRFPYKWDFSARLVPLGFWDEVLLQRKGHHLLRDIWLQPLAQEGVLNVSGIVARSGSGGKSAEPCMLKYKVEVRFEGEIAASAERWIDSPVESSTFLETKLSVEKPELWYPNGTGAQPLYEVEIQLWENDSLSDRWEGRTGFRSLTWERSEGAPDDALPYTMVVNGRKVYIKGANITPLDVLYGNVTEERYRRFVQELKEAHINLVRVWGGGVIEKEIFYELCDRHGIMIWQEFIQSSSGIDNVPSKDPRFLELLRETATAAIKVKRNHVSLACWSGGNELTDDNGVPVTYDDENIAMLRDLVRQYDPHRLFLPTSASGPREFLAVDEPGTNYDVHGPWKYGGATNHYYMFNHSDSMLHSEFGVDGCCAVRSMEKFLGEEDREVTSVRDNQVWRHHGEWWDTLERSREFFGDIATLSGLVAASQWVQAEGIRYALEANRRRKYRNSGSIVWQFNEPWPNVSCTSLVDYYGLPKMAYFWVRKAYAPIHLSLKYDSLLVRPGERFAAECYVQNSMDAGLVKWRAECFDLSGAMLWRESGERSVPGNATIRLAEFAMDIDCSTPEVFAVRVQIEGLEPNVYFFSTLRKDYLKALLHAPQPILQATLKETAYSETGECVRKFLVRNIGEAVALYVTAETIRPADDPVFCLQNYSILLPEEERLFIVRCPMSERQADPPEVEFVAWNK
ncbi:glycoside hydrolase family 2 protein [Cohnella soli]|uniref:beta-mannosidase n=1 Tax=Cohnella soli TaxID=425005 RepID=A0ABW0I0C2_9BACL